jgi:hypothetical protein
MAAQERHHEHAGDQKDDSGHEIDDMIEVAARHGGTHHDQPDDDRKDREREVRPQATIPPMPRRFVRWKRGTPTR